MLEIQENITSRKKYSHIDLVRIIDTINLKKTNPMETWTCIDFFVN